jgi:hypothetical protein
LQHRKRQITLKQRMGLCLAAFFAAFAMQLTLNGYQSRAVQAVQDAQMGCFNAISRFQGGVESSISVLENYRWENSEPEEIIDRLQSASSTCNAWAVLTCSAWICMPLVWARRSRQWPRSCLQAPALCARPCTSIRLPADRLTQ